MGLREREGEWARVTTVSRWPGLGAAGQGKGGRVSNPWTNGVHRTDGPGEEGGAAR